MKKKTGRGKPAKSGGYQPKQDQKNGSIFIFELISWAIAAVIVISVLTQIPSFDRWLEKTIYASEERAIKKKKEQERREQEHQKEEVQKQTEQESNILLLVNAQHKLPENCEIEVVPLLTEYEQSVNVLCYEQAKAMLEDCRNAGNAATVCSSYRAHEKQVLLFQEEIEKYRMQGYSKAEARKKAATAVAIPGTSEHELGLAMDIVDKSYQLLDAGQENTPTQQWLLVNSYKYGFILRYPKDKSEITGIIYEPWHYRYVGEEAAKYIYEHQLCLEEYLDIFTEN